MDRLVEKFADNLIVNNTIEAEDRELYTYGLKQGLILILNIATIFVVGLIFSVFWESVFFLVVYSPLRTFAGGAHARTQTRCYIFSILLIVVVLMLINFIAWTSILILCVALCAGAIIFALAPVEDLNKPLDEIEVEVYRKKTRILLLIEICVLIVFVALNQMVIATCIAVSLLALSVMLIIGIAINKNAIKTISQ